MLRELVRFGSAASVADWSAIDDTVMGGVSRSRLRHDPAGHAVFEGVVSLERYGGFASVRSRPMDLGLAGAVCYLLEVRGDGKRFKLNLRTDDAFDGMHYQSAFEAPAGTWTLVRLPLSDFRASFRGRNVPDAPPLDSARVRQIGLMIADRQAGSFALALRSICVE
jgi:NADH dehydrogenase [ubiquinone] 1 alpha subcomplex assembly factor 1